MIHGTANYKDGVLTIKTKAKRGKKYVENVQVYEVCDLDPDPRCAYPAFSLRKKSGEVWHIAVETYGPTCSCPHATFRGGNSREVCKHISAARAVGLLPKIF